MKVEDIGIKAQQKIVHLKAQGLSNQAIADQISDEFQTMVSRDDVTRYLNRHKEQATKIIKEDKKLQKRLVDQYFSTVEQLRELNAEMWKFFYEIRKDPEFTEKRVECPHCGSKFNVRLKNYQTLLKTADHILRQIQHVDAVLGKMSKKSLTINYNYVDLSKKLTQVMPSLLNEYEKRGIIKVKKKKVKEFF